MSKTTDNLKQWLVKDALKYARMKCFGAEIKSDGAVEYVCPSQQEALTKTLGDIVLRTAEALLVSLADDKEEGAP